MAEWYDGVLYPSLRGYTLLLIIVAVTVYYRVIYICILLGLGLDVYDCEYHVLAVDFSGECTLGTVVVASAETIARLLASVACLPCYW